MPKNREDLAFYSIMQLASLVKNKKISSEELTKFFLERLKQWGDTLHSVITLTEELAFSRRGRPMPRSKQENTKDRCMGFPMD
jgi:Asp-tRNA(Asn)/Glu-tRNA(Gln) amidotransferase A subunit family amidase